MPDNNQEQAPWFDDYADETQEFQIDEYDLTQSPNDFNVTTIFSFIESGSVKIPGFQRHYVWDSARASKLVESLILGLPVPQLFLYEEGRNSFLVIDGQQRLMSIYYFIKERFPRKEKRAALKNIFAQEGKIPDTVLAEDEYFEPFRLKLPAQIPGQPNKFDKKTYSSLGDYKSRFDLRPIRNVIVKQNVPRDDDSSIYEIFNRLNSGGMNLRPQEIRTSLYHSGFYEMLYRINRLEGWRRILKTPEPDLHNKDIEILLRGFAMLLDSEEYAPSMVRFLNLFSKKSRQQTDDQNAYLEKLFESFVQACQDLSENAFINPGNNRFSISLYEAVFTAACRDAFARRALVNGRLREEEIDALESDPTFVKASTFGTTAAANVRERLGRAKALVFLH
jgi:uncharacterized protein with ParB-like and HNH nuclease domain